MNIYSYSSIGFDGELVAVGVDIRRGIPGIEIVGLPDSAVREARERVRVSIRNSGFVFPAERILVNLAPAGIRKEGAAFDLAIAIGVLCASGQLRIDGDHSVLVMGELELSGRVRKVRSVLSAVDTGIRAGISDFLLPEDNLPEGRVLKKGYLRGISLLSSAGSVFGAPVTEPGGAPPEPSLPVKVGLDFADLRGQAVLKRALEIAAAGGHHVFLFGPPGCGKTMAALRFPGLLPDLDRQEAVTVTRIYSNAGLLPDRAGLIVEPPFRTPHHSASLEGLLGGGRLIRPGEVSLAHKGVLFLDEAPEFRRNALQCLREPLESLRVTIARAGASYWFSSDFQLILAANPCPCGNLGWDDKVCLCSSQETAFYWKKLRGPLLDRIDIRVPVKPVPPEELLQPGCGSTNAMRSRVLSAIEIQKTRFNEYGFNRNARIPAAQLDTFCTLSQEVRRAFQSAARQLSLSSRAMHSVIRIARTIADLENHRLITLDHLYEAVQHRRYGDQEFSWNTP